MAQTINKLSARAVATLTAPGRHGDGGGLYLSISTNGGRRWTFLYKRQGKLREMGLGAAAGTNRPGVSLADARKAAEQARQLLAQGVDPLDAKHGDEDDDIPELATVPTFGAEADALVASMSTSWKNDKHKAQWVTTLKSYAAPLRPKAVDAITTQDVLDVLQPIWTTKAETASRLRGRIEMVLAAAAAKGHRSGVNPAQWRGHLDRLLPKRHRLTRGHHGAMGYEDVPAFVKALRAAGSVSHLAMEFTILTAARSGETLGARWSEFDLKAKVWTVPAERMKGGREHRVPLTPRVLAILDEMAKLSDGPDGFVFPSRRRGAGLSSMALEMVLRRMKQKEAGVTVHGFRSSFRDWVGEETSFPREVAEAALAHLVGDDVERAYRRGDALAKRRELMDAWEAYVSK